MSSPNVIPLPGAAAAMLCRRLADSMSQPAAVITRDQHVLHGNVAWKRLIAQSDEPQVLTVLDDAGRACDLQRAAEPFEAHVQLSLPAPALRLPVIVTPIAGGEFGLVVQSPRATAEPPGTQTATPFANADVAWLLFDQAFEPSFTWWVSGEQRVITSWNTAAERLYGFPRALAIGQDPRALLRTRCEGGMEVVDAALARDGQWRGELFQTCEHGQEVRVETVMRLIVLPEGQHMVLETSRDVTLERRAERETQRRLRLALSASKTGIWERDFATGEAYWSPEAFAVLGVDPSEFQVSMEAFERMLHPEDAPRLRAEVDKVLAGAAGFECTFRIRGADGAERWLHNNAIAVRSDSSTAPRVIGTVRDITHERQLSAELAESEATHRQLANAMPQIVWTCGPDGRVDWLNERWFEYTGMQPPLEYESVSAHVHPDDVVEIQRRWEESVASGTQWEAEYRLRDRAGTYQWHLGRMVPIPAADGSIARLIATATNIEERKRAEEVLRETDRRKDEFLAMLSHELRNPLAPILTAVQLMKLQAHGEALEERDVIERQARHMVRLVDDLLDVSKVAQGKIELRLRPVSLEQIVVRAVELVAPLVEKKKHTLHLEVPHALTVDADQERLLQVVSNLLTNAARYTPEGGRISVVARQEGREAILQVLDNGIGITADLLPRVFDMFVQGPRSFDRSEGGLGLGLALASSLTKLHGGSVSAHSAGAGLGSEFVVRLPLSSMRSADSVPVPAPHAPAHRNILVVDDNEDAAVLLARALRIAGHVVCVAHDPATALEALASFRPDLAILDIGLPVMDGYQLGRELKQRFGAGITLYALSGYAQERDRELSREAGFARHLVKPVEVRALLDHIAAEASDRA